MIPHGRPSLVDERLEPEDGKNDKRTLPIDEKVKLREEPTHKSEESDAGEKQAHPDYQRFSRSIVGPYAFGAQRHGDGAMVGGHVPRYGNGLGAHLQTIGLDGSGTLIAEAVGQFVVSRLQELGGAGWAKNGFRGRSLPRVGVGGVRAKDLEALAVGRRAAACLTDISGGSHRILSALRGGQSV
jgi:hypothetical protein